MNLLVLREPSSATTTLGCLFVDGRWQSFTCEDVLREVAGTPVGTWKVPGATAIPAGRYECVLSHSQRFQRVLPEVRGVPGFSGIRIHAGNTHHDTEGCLLVGMERGMEQVYRSRMALDDLIRKMGTAKEPIWLTIRNPTL